MSKVAKSFRLDPVAVEHLDELVRLTGSSQAAIIEQALAVHRSLLFGGLAGPRRILAATTPVAVQAAGVTPEPKPQRPQRSAAQKLSEARGAERRTLSRQVAQTAAQPPAEPASGVYRVRAKGNIYEFPFPVAQVPSKGSGSCPCGSGKRFAQCHTREFQKALKAGITQRG
jgi:hypothetical protein